MDLTYLAVEPTWDLQLLSRTEFLNRWVWHVGYPHNNRLDPATIVAFNAPFDLSRIARDVAEARGDLRGGFSFTLWQDQNGRPRPWRPRLAVKVLDSKRAIKKFRRLERNAHDHAEPDLVVVKSYGQVLREYRLHPEHKFNGPDGKPCGRNTTGILHRRPVHVLDIRHIGKEANRLDDVQAGLIGDLSDVLTEYHAGDADLFRRLVLPVLDRYSGRQLAQMVNTDRRTIDRIRGLQQPRPVLRDALTALAVNIAEPELARTPHQQSQQDPARLPHHQPLAILAAWHDQFWTA